MVKKKYFAYPTVMLILATLNWKHCHKDVHVNISESGMCVNGTQRKRNSTGCTDDVDKYCSQ